MFLIICQFTPVQRFLLLSILIHHPCQRTVKAERFTGYPVFFKQIGKFPLIFLILMDRPLRANKALWNKSAVCHRCLSFITGNPGIINMRQEKFINFKHPRFFNQKFPILFIRMYLRMYFKFIQMLCDVSDISKFTCPHESCRHCKPVHFCFIKTADGLAHLIKKSQFLDITLQRHTHIFRGRKDAFRQPDIFYPVHNAFSKCCDVESFLYLIHGTDVRWKIKVFLIPCLIFKR